MVVDDLGDGTLFVAARKTKRIHDEESILTLSGYVRREDIDENRMVRSARLHSLDLSYTGSGSLTSNYTRSIWGWLLDLIWF
jgi:flagellar basal body L-ring protein FlgH